MATRRQEKQLTNRQVANIRANQARRCSTILTRVAKFAEGTLDGEMTQAQLKAAQLIINSVLPAQQATTIEDVTQDTRTKADVEAMAKQARETLMAGMNRQQLEAMLESLEASKQ